MYGTHAHNDDCQDDRLASVEASADGRVRTITFGRPAVLNAMNRELSTAATRAVREAAAEAHVVVLRGAGGNFSVGGDVAEVQALRDQGAEALGTLFEAFAELLRSVREAEVPVVAAVEGYALAGGFELMQVCDVVIVADTVVLGDHHIRAGQVPAGGGSQLLPRAVGRQRALAHLLTGDRLDAATAVAWGLAYRAAPADEFDAVLGSVVERLATKDRDALRRMKSLVNRGLELPLDEALALEREVVLDVTTWRDFE